MDGLGRPASSKPNSADHARRRWQQAGAT